MSTIAQRVQSQVDILETIKSINGQKYADFIKHSVTTAMLAGFMPPELHKEYVMVMAIILTDLAKATGVQIEDPQVQARIEKDIASIRSVQRTK